MESYEGIKAIMRLPAPMSSMQITSDAFRPSLSPTTPKISPPSGRARKPPAKTASVDSTADCGSPVLKKLAAR